MHPTGLVKMRTVRLIALLLAFLAILGSPLLHIASARSPDRSAALAPTAVPGHWEFTAATTRDKFHSDWEPGSSWYPSPGTSSGGGTIISVTSPDSVRVETSCSWSVSGDSQVLMPGQTLQVALSVNSNVTGQTPAANLASGDSLVVSAFGAGNASAQDKYSIYGQQSVSANGSGGGSFAVPSGSIGKTQTIEFVCNVDAGMGQTYTDWNYAWVEGSMPTVSATPSISPTITATPTISLTPTITPPPAPGSGDALAGFLAAAGVSAAVIGAILAAAGLVAILIDGGKKGGKPTPKPIGPPVPQPPPMRYALRVSARSVDVYPSEPASVTFSAMRIPPEGEPEPAIEAAIQVLVPSSPAGLVASPASGVCSVVCVFSVPNPRVCATLNVSATASVGGRVLAQTNVQVRILPVYELELKWEDPRQPAVVVDGNELRAWARVIATPPDPDSPPDILAGKINVSVQGPNSDWIRQPLNPFIQYEKQWNAIAAVRPGAASELQPANPVLVAQFNSGRQLLIAKLNLELNQELELGAWAGGKKLSDVVYNEAADPPGWSFGNLTVYFHPPQAEDKPMVPGFGSDIKSPEFQVEPADILEIKNYSEEGQPGRYTAEIALREGVDLEKLFGPDLTEQDARIKLTIKVTSETGKVYTSNLTYQICPTVELVICQGNEDGSEKADKHTYKDNELSPLQFVADSEDNLVITTWFRRTDWLSESSRVVRFGAISQAQLEGKLKQEFKLGVTSVLDEADVKAFVAVPETPGRWYTFVRSRKPLLYTSSRRSTTLSVNISGELKNAPPYYRAKNTDFSKTGVAAKQELVPLYIYLKLWVIPGKQRETSTVGALTMIVKADGSVIIAPKYTLDEIGGIERAGNDRFGNRVVNANTPDAVKAKFAALTNAPDGDLFREPITYPLELKVISDGFSVETHPLDKLDVGPELTNPCPAWLQAWKLWYKGLNWDTVVPVNSATFTVLCRIGDSDEAAAFRVDVGANLKEMWADFDDARPSLDLDNPEIHGASPVLWLLAIRRELFGWWYDLRNMFVRPLLYSPLTSDDPWERYLCAALTRRLLNYFVPRRMGVNNPETALKMNGIEFLGYAVFLPGGIGYHSWAGMYLSGSDPLKDAIYMDPWWNQKWDEDASKFDYGYKKQLAKFTLTAVLVATELVVIGRAIYAAIQLRQGLFLNVPTFEDIMFWLKKIVQDFARWMAGVLTGEQFLLSIDKNLEWKGCFDGESRYENNNELRLFEHFQSELLGKPLPPINPEKW